MKQNNTVQWSPKRGAAGPRGPITIGLDLGDKSSRYCVLDEQGEVLREASAATTKKGRQLAFGARPRCRIAIEVGAHSPWVSRLLSKLGHEVIVANARQVRLISHSSRKDSPAGRAGAGAAGARRSAVAASDPPSQRESAAGPDGDPGPRDAGGGAHGADQLGARSGQSPGRAAAGLRRRQSDVGRRPGGLPHQCAFLWRINDSGH